ncbi:MAG: ribose-phosphate diphosphokinase [Gemmatimonadota bacterium]
MDGPVLLSGTPHPALARSLADALGIEPAQVDVGRFPDGEVSVRLRRPVADRRVILVQPLAPPVNDSLLELLALADASRRAGAFDVTAVIPYLAYARADSRSGRDEPVTARLVADQIQAAGIGRVVALDLHAAAIEGFFTVPVEHRSAVGALAGALAGRLPPETVVVSPDLGRVEDAVRYGEHLDLPIAAVAKRRRSGTTVEATVVIGDVRDRPCVIIDDMISTGGTIVEAVRALTEAGARPEITVAATHGIFVSDALARIEAAGVREVWVTDSLPRRKDAAGHTRVVPIAPVLAEAVRRLFGFVRDV